MSKGNGFLTSGPMSLFAASIIYLLWLVVILLDTWELVPYTTSEFVDKNAQFAGIISGSSIVIAMISMYNAVYQGKIGNRRIATISISVFTLVAPVPLIFYSKDPVTLLVFYVFFFLLVASQMFVAFNHARDHLA